MIFKKINANKNNLNILWDHDSVTEIDWARGAAVMFSRELLSTVGLLDERFFIYGEEIDFFYRAKKQGIKAVFLPDIEIIHHGKCSSRQKKAEMFIQNYKSFYIFLKKHYPFNTYFFYRFRVYFLLLIWSGYYLIASIFVNKNSIEEQQKVYSKLLFWHFSKKSFIKI